MPLGHADLYDDRERLARLEEKVKAIERVEANAERLEIRVHALEKKQVRTEIANVLIFGMAVLVLAGFFGMVVATFQGRPPGAPVSIRTNGGHP